MFNKRVIIYILLFVISISLFGQEVTDVKKDYAKDLALVISYLQQEKCIELKMLEQVIPSSNAEFEKFYSYYRDAYTRDLFEILDQIIGNNAYRNKSSFLVLYINMSQYINGKTVSEEYLRNYYYDLDFIIENNKEFFCDYYLKLDSIASKNLKGFYNSFCDN